MNVLKIDANWSTYIRKVERNQRINFRKLPIRTDFGHSFKLSRYGSFMTSPLMYHSIKIRHARGPFLGQLTHGEV